MGDRFATIDMGCGLRTQAASVNREPYLRAAVPLSVGQLGPYVTQCRLSPWAEAYLRTKWHLDPCNRLSSTIDQSYRQTERTGQRSRSIGPVTVAPKQVVKVTWQKVASPPHTVVQSHSPCGANVHMLFVPTRVDIQNDISIGSAVLAGSLSWQTDRKTDRPTDHANPCGKRTKDKTV